MAKSKVTDEVTEGFIEREATKRSRPWAKWIFFVGYRLYGCDAGLLLFLLFLTFQ